MKTFRIGIHDVTAEPLAQASVEELAHVRAAIRRATWNCAEKRIDPRVRV